MVVLVLGLLAGLVLVVTLVLLLDDHARPGRESEIWRRQQAIEHLASTAERDIRAVSEHHRRQALARLVKHDHTNTERR